MKTKMIYIPLIAAFLLLSVQGDLLAKTLAIVIKAKGTVSLYKGNKVSQDKLRRGTRLEAGDKIVAGSRGYVALRFTDDKSLLRIRENSTCTIRTRQEQNETIKNVFLEVGTIYARVTKQRAKFEVQTPTSVASVKGTAWITEQILDGATYYYGKEGTFEVSNEVASALCGAGQTVEVLSANSAPTTRDTRPGEGLWDEDALQEDYEFGFENEDGQKRLLRFRIRVEQ